MIMKQFRISMDVKWLSIWSLSQRTRTRQGSMSRTGWTNPYEVAREAERYVSYDIVDVTEEEPEQPEPDRRRF